MPFTSWEDFVALIAVILVALPMHEFAHAWTAVRLGDDTPRWQGRLTLDPRAHIDPWGALFLLLTGFGWAKPVPFSPAAVRRGHPRGPLLVALAGPAANLSLAVLATALGVLPPWPVSAFPRVLLQFAWFNALLAFFNLLPLPPLDGSHIVRELFPRAWAQYFAPLERYALLVFLALFWVLPRFGLPVLTWLVVWPARALLQGLFALLG